MVNELWPDILRLFLLINFIVQAKFQIAFGQNLRKEVLEDVVTTYEGMSPGKCIFLLNVTGAPEHEEHRDAYELQ